MTARMKAGTGSVIESLSARSCEMELGLFGLVVVVCALFAQTLLVPIHIINGVHLPLPLWLGSVQTWFTVGAVLWLSAWLMGDR
jgi:hypothetical protein